MAFELRRPPKLTTKHESYPYQLDAVRAIEALPYAAVFHEQGLGKTKIAVDLILGWLTADVIDTVFVITKKSLVQNWRTEIGLHTYITPSTLAANRRENSIALNSPVLIYIMNYEVVSANLELIGDFLVTCRVAAILDESQRIKNPDAYISRCFQSVRERFVRRIIMTGTPVANRPYDIWAQIRFLDGGEALGTSFATFRADLELPTRSTRPFADAQLEHADTATCTDYTAKLADVMDRIRRFTVRETKQTAGLELPDKTIRTVFVDLAPQQAAIYKSYRDALMYEIRAEHGNFIDDAEYLLKRLVRLVQSASNPGLLDHAYDELPAKYVSLLKLFEEIEPHSNKVIVWTCFVDNVKWLARRLCGFGAREIHGRMGIEDRNYSIDRFKFDEQCRVLVATPGAAKEGLTLTVANHAVFYDRSFSLDDYLQAQDRIHRISQTVNCFVHNMIARNTIDEWIDQLLHAKYQAAQLTQGDISRREFDASFADDLPEQLMKVLSRDDGRG